MEIKNESITSLTQIVEVAEKFTPILPILFIVAIALYFRGRSGSSYGIKNRLYTLLSGNKGFYNKSLSTRWNEQQDIERFNALFNLNAKSTSDIIAFDDWIKKYSLDIRRFSQIKGWFNTNKLQIRKANSWYITLVTSTVLFLFVLSLSITGLGISNSALLQFKKEGWIWLNSTVAQPFYRNPFKSQERKWSISSADCAEKEFNIKKIAVELHIEQGTLQTICNSFNDDEDKKYLSSVLKSQKQLLWFAAILCLWTTFQLFYLLKLKRVKETKDYLNNCISNYEKERATENK